jgi:hypothetical protein
MHSKFIRLALVAVIALGLAFWAGTRRQPSESATGQASELVPGLKAAINDIKTLTIKGAENAVIVTLKRTDSGWVVAEKSDYPADMAKVREYLLKLADATLAEAKTTVKESYPKLGVEDLDSKDAKGALLEIEGLAQPARVIIGNFNGRGGEGTFVRIAGQAQSWLAKGNLTVDKVAANWLQRDIVDLQSSRIASVEITTGGKTLRVFKNAAGDANYQVADVPKGRELSSEFVANGLASVLSGLRFDDVLSGAQNPPEGAKAYDVVYRGFDGLDVSAKAWESDGKDYAQFSAAFDEARAGAMIDADQAKAKAEYEAKKAEAEAAAQAASAAAKDGAEATPAAPPAAPMPEAPLAVTDAAKDRADRLAALRKEAETLNTTFQGWTFVLPNYKFANMNKTMDDLLKPLEAKAK